MVAGEVEDPAQETAGATDDIARNISNAAQAAERTTTVVADGRQAAANLAAISAEFRGLVSGFRS